MASPSSAPPADTPPAEEWEAQWFLAGPELDELARRYPPRSDVRVMRSSQLDAARLDEELTSLLRSQFMRIFALFRPGLVARLQPELMLALELLVFRFSLWRGQPLPGMALMNLRYRNEAAVPPPARWAGPAVAGPPAAGGPTGGGAAGSTASPGGGGGESDRAGSSAAAGGLSGVEGPGLSAWQRSAFLLGDVLLRYGWGRLGHHAASRHWGGQPTGGGWRAGAWSVLRAGESAYQAAALLNLLAFLRGGRYRSLLERLLRARAVYAAPSALRALSFEYLNRQLVWSELSELLLWVLPLVDADAAKRALRRALPRLPALLAGPGAGAGAAGAGGGGACGACGTPDVLDPYLAVPCGHRHCYACLRGRCLADPGYACALCLTRVDAMRPEPLAPARRPGAADRPAPPPNGPAG